MNDTAQETTAVMTLLVEHELLGASVLPVEGGKKSRDHIAALLLIKYYNYITSISNIETP